MKTLSDGKLLLFHKSQYPQAETALVYGQLLLIYALRTQNAHFEHGLEGMIEDRLEEWRSMIEELQVGAAY